MNQRRSRLLLTSSLLLVVLSAPLGALQSDHAVLGSDNTIFQLLRGTYGELFPDGRDAAADSAVLALDVLREDGSRERWLVPATESGDAEDSEILVYQRESNRVYLFWETLVSGIHPTLYLTSFDGTQWGELIQFVGSPFARKQGLQLVVSRASGIPPANGEQARVLTVLHVFWSEERPRTSLKRYAPIAFIDGEYAGSTRVYDLDALITDTLGSPYTPISTGIAEAVAAQRGKNSRSCVVGFLDPSTHRLQTLEIEVLSPVLVDFADKVRAELIGIGQRTDSLDHLAVLSVAMIQELGSGFHDSVLTFMSDRAAMLIKQPGNELNEEGLNDLADKVRAELIGIGSRIGPNGVVNLGDVQFLEISPADVGEEIGHLLKVTPVSSRVAPEVDGEATLWLSENGRHVLVTWEDERGIYYRESLDDEDGWSDVGTLEPGNGLDRDEIYRTLAERVRSR
jgi:hypothetical protein